MPTVWWCWNRLIKVFPRETRQKAKGLLYWQGVLFLELKNMQQNGQGIIKLRLLNLVLQYHKYCSLEWVELLSQVQMYQDFMGLLHKNYISCFINLGHFSHFSGLTAMLNFLTEESLIYKIPKCKNLWGKQSSPDMI